MSEREKRKFRTEIPNMIDDADLTVYAFRLYAHIKRVAGDAGKCWQSTRTLAEACRMSTASVSRAKKELLAAELIEITENQGQHGGREWHEICVKDIWEENLSKYEGYTQVSDRNAKLPGETSQVSVVRRKKEQNSKSTPAKNRTFSLAVLLGEICCMNFEANKGRLLREAKLLRKAEPEPDEETLQENYGSGGWWYREDWRGKKGELPTPATIRETWARWTNGKAPSKEPAALKSIREVESEFGIFDLEEAVNGE